MSSQECSQPGCRKEGVWRCTHCWSWQCCEQHFDHDCEWPGVGVELDEDSG
jgi:hypothetical protein